jgi:hypothetical protein
MNKYNKESQPHFLLVDFNCSQVYTHHWASLLAYSKLIGEAGYHAEIWLPKYSNPEIGKKLIQYGRVIRTLRSPQYGPTSWSEDPISFLLNHLCSHGFFISTLRKLRLRSFLVSCLLSKLWSHLTKEMKTKDITIVFPTLDLLGLEVIKRIQRSGKRINIVARRMGSECTSPLSDGSELSIIEELINDADASQLRIGIPTLSLLGDLQSRSKFPDRFWWSPLPPERRTCKQKRSKSSHVKIGFPGAAKKSKGFQMIPLLVKKLMEENIPSEIFIQRAAYAWQGYDEVLEELVDICPNLTIMGAILTVDEFERLMCEMDIVCLPYDPTFYHSADSGVLYQSADRNKPVLCFDGLGFTQEVVENGVGIALNPYHSFSLREILEKSLSKEISDNIERYNNLREQVVRSALQI